MQSSGGSCSTAIIASTLQWVHPMDVQLLSKNLYSVRKVAVCPAYPESDLGIDSHAFPGAEDFLVGYLQGQEAPIN